MSVAVESIHGGASLDSVPESRRAARRAVDWRCELITTRWDRGVISRCTDLSPHGMWLETTMPLDAGERVVLCFSLPKQRLGFAAAAVQHDRAVRPGVKSELMVFARVTRIERDAHDMLYGSSGVGLEFQDLTAEEQRLLESALRGLPPVLPGHKRDRRAAGTPASAS